MSTDKQTPTGAEQDAQPAQDELSTESLESVSGGIIGDCTGGGWPTKPPFKPVSDYPNTTTSI